MGLLDTIKIRKAGFSFRSDFTSFLKHYSELLPKNINPINSIKIFFAENFANQIDKDILFGKSKIYLRETVVQKIDEKIKELLIIKRKKAEKIWIQYIVYKRKKKLKDWLFCFKKYKKMIITLQKKCRTKIAKRKLKIINISFRLLNIYQKIRKKKTFEQINFAMNLKKKLASAKIFLDFMLKIKKTNQLLTLFKIKQSSTAIEKQRKVIRNLELGLKNTFLFFIKKNNDYKSSFLLSCKSSLNQLKMSFLQDSSELTIQKTAEYKNLENEKASSHSDSSSSTDPIILHKKSKNLVFSEIKCKQSIILNSRESVLSTEMENRSNSISIMSLSKICFFDDNMKNNQTHILDEDFFNFGIIDPRGFQNLNFLSIARFFVNQRTVLPPQHKLDTNNYRDSASFSGIPNSDDCFRDLKVLDDNFFKYMNDFNWKEGFSKLVCERKKWGSIKLFDEIMNYSSKVYYL